MIQIIIMKKESMYKYLHLLHAPFENVGDRVIVHPTSSLPPLASVYHKALGAATSVFPCTRTSPNITLFHELFQWLCSLDLLDESFWGFPDPLRIS